MKNIADFLARLEGVRPAGDSRWTARCPAHDDNNPSLSVTSTADGAILVKCHAGCSFEEIRKAMRLEAREFRLKVGGDCRGVGKTGAADRRLAATYDYKDEKGVLLYQVCRFEPKSFRQRRPDGKGGWVWNLDGVRRVLYRLPELLAAALAALVFIVEGEKDVDSLRAIDLVATTNPAGAAPLMTMTIFAWCAVVIT
jgi:hypothetical protein